MRLCCRFLESQSDLSSLSLSRPPRARLLPPARVSVGLSCGNLGPRFRGCLANGDGCIICLELLRVCVRTRTFPLEKPKPQLFEVAELSLRFRSRERLDIGCLRGPETAAHKLRENGTLIDVSRFATRRAYELTSEILWRILVSRLSSEDLIGSSAIRDTLTTSKIGHMWFSRHDITGRPVHLNGTLGTGYTRPTIHGCIHLARRNRAHIIGSLFYW